MAKIAVILLLLVSLIALRPAMGMAQDDAGGAGTLVLPTDAAPWELSVALSQSTFSDGQGDEVVLARDDRFADALASGGLQGTRPLLLIPSTGPLPEGVREELVRLGTTTALLLGGEAALSEEIADELEDARIATRRLAGPERLSTAVAIAGELPDANTAILARAYGDTEDPSRAFADALAAGGLAAERGWPVVLTDTETLSTSTEEWLSGGVDRVLIVGGTLAVSDAVEQRLVDLGIQVSRIADSNRFGTAVEIAKTLDDDGSGVARGILLEGTGPDAWQAGFAAAARSAALDAPIVLAAATVLPAETREWLHSGVATSVEQDDPAVLTCVVEGAICEQGRRAVGLPAEPIITVDPVDGAAVFGGQEVTITVDPAEEIAGRPVSVTLCATDSDAGMPVSATASELGVVTVLLPDTIPDPCTMRADVELSGGGEGSLVWELHPRPKEEVYSLDLGVFADADQFSEPFGVELGYGFGPREGQGGAGGSFFALVAPTERGALLAPLDAILGEHFFQLRNVETTFGALSVTPQEGVALESWSMVVHTPHSRTVLDEGTDSSIIFDPLELDPDVFAYELEVQFAAADGPLPTPTPPDTGGDGSIVVIHSDVELTCPEGSVAQDDDVFFTVYDGTVCTASAAAGQQLVVIQIGTPIDLAESVEVVADGDRGTITVVSVPS